MNVASGGTLIQHLEEATPQEHFPLDAKVDPDLRSNAVHSVTVKADSLLAKALGQGEVAVNSLHHQAADSVAEGFTVVARAEDGVVEAIEGPGSFQLGVQFHPEDLRKSDSRFQELFVGLVESTLVFA